MKGLFFGTASRPADALILPLIPDPGEAPHPTTAIYFMVSGAFSTDYASIRKATRRAAGSSDAIVNAATVKNPSDYHIKVAQAWDFSHPNTPLPRAHPNVPNPDGGLDEVTGFHFKPSIFDSFGGCSNDTEHPIVDYAKCIAARKGRMAK